MERRYELLHIRQRAASCYCVTPYMRVPRVPTFEKMLLLGQSAIVAAERSASVRVRSCRMRQIRLPLFIVVWSPYKPRYAGDDAE